jgi:hypothetical protein
VRFVRNLVLLGQPGAEVDQPATVAAKRPVDGFRRPLYRPFTRGAFYRCRHEDVLSLQEQQVRRKGTSRSTCTGLLVASCQLRNRMVHRCWLPLISGNKSVSAGSVTRTS